MIVKKMYKKMKIKKYFFKKILVRKKYNINKNNQRLEILKGYLIVFANLDKIIKIIRTKDDPKKEIINVFKLSEVQAEAILNMRLGALKKLDELNLNKEIKKLRKYSKMNNDDYIIFVRELVSNSNNNFSEKTLKKFCEIKIMEKVYKFDINLNNWENEDYNNVFDIFVDFIKTIETIKKSYEIIKRKEKVKSILNKKQK